MLVRKSIFILLITCIPIVAEIHVTSTEIIHSMKKGVLGVKKLLKKVSIYQLFSEDKTLLHYAVKEGNYEIVQFLINQNVLLSQKGGQFYGTALHDAIYYGHLRIAQLLIEEGTPVNEQDIDGNTPLHLVAEDGDLPLIEILLEYGASKSIFNNSGQIPYDKLSLLTWDNNDKLHQLLAISKNINDFDSIEFSINKSKIPKSNTNNRVSKQLNNSKIINHSHIGISIQTHKD